MQISNTITVLASIAVLAAVAAAAGAHIQHCDGSDEKSYQGDGACNKWDAKSNFEVSRLGKKCTDRNVCLQQEVGWEREAVGSAVKDFRVEDLVVTYFAPRLVESSGDDAFVASMLGQGTDGTLRSKGVFQETALVHAPRSLGWLPAATLTCTWTTAGTSLFGIKGKEAGPGTWVLIQGTGGVSIARLQLAAAVGATVVGTTSTGDKAARVKALGSTHTVNYRSNPDNWAQEARNITPDKRGFDIVIDIAGNEILAQSLAAVRVDGVVLVIGMIGGDAEPVPLFAAMQHTCIVRGIIAGSRSQLKELVRFIDEEEITPAVDDVVFELAEAKDAYRRLKEKKHFSKVVIQIDHPET